MKKIQYGTMLIFLALICSIAVLTGTASAVPGVPGGQLYATGNEMEVEILPYSAAYTNEIWLYDPISTPSIFIGNNSDVGDVVSIGTPLAGDELEFGIISPEGTFYMGPASRNLDGYFHAYLENVRDGVWNVYFEDRWIFGNPGSYDYYDANIQVRDVCAPSIDKELDHTSGELGDHVTVTLDVTANCGAVVVDTLPEGFTYIEDTFTVNGESKIPTIDKNEISYTLDDSGVIEFQVKVSEARSWESMEVCNVATATHSGTGNQDSDEACYEILPFGELVKNFDGDMIIPPFTETSWVMEITVTNTFGFIMTDTRITDRLGAELEIDEILQVTHGDVDYYTKGKSEKVFLTWDIGDLNIGETATLELTVSTDLNPAGKQEYSSSGEYDLNSGATLKFIDPEETIQLSSYTDSISVVVTENGP